MHLHDLLYELLPLLDRSFYMYLTLQANLNIMVLLEYYYDFSID